MITPPPPVNNYICTPLRWGRKFRSLFMDTNIQQYYSPTKKIHIKINLFIQIILHIFVMVLYIFPLSWGTTLQYKAGWSILGPVTSVQQYKGMANFFNILFFYLKSLLYLSTVPYNDKGIKGWHIIECLECVLQPAIKNK